ncbi:MAG: VPS10 domain-containing protein [Ignavibacteria bacterium]
MKSIVLFLCLVFGINLHAQIISQYTPYDENIPGIIKSHKPSFDSSYPDWAKELYVYPANAEKVRKGLVEYSRIHPNAHSAIIRYAKQWLNLVMDYTDELGIVHLPAKEIITSKSKNEVSLAGKGNWSFWGPKETFWLNESGSTTAPKACPWQVNIYAFDVSESNPSILYAGTETGFVAKTTDKGLNWTQAGRDYYFGGGITAVAVHPTNPDIAFVSGGKQLHATTDGGKTWKAMLTERFGADRLKIDPKNPAIMIAAAPEGVFRSENQGATWTKVWSMPAYDIEFTPGNSNNVYALVKENTNFRLVQSTDGGKTFTIQTAFPADIVERSGGLLAMTAANPGIMYAILLSSDDIPHLLKGRVGGTTPQWTTVRKGKTTEMPMDNWQGYYDLVFDVSPKDSNLLFTGTASLYKSTNGGSTFSIIGGYGGNIPVHPDQQDMKLMPNGDFWIATDGGLTLSTDAFSNPNNSFARNNGIVGSDFWGFDQGWTEDIIIGGRYHNGNTAISDMYQPKALRMGGAESPTGWVLHHKDRHVAFNDLGNGWILPKTATGKPEGRFIYSKFPNMEEYGGRRGNLLHHPDYSTTVFVGEGKGFWMSKDAGSTWDLMHAFDNPVRFMQISYAEKDPIIYADIVNEGIYRSEDLGKTWKAKPSLYATPNGTNAWKGRTHISVSPTNGNVVYATFSNGTWSADIGKVFRSTDGGDTWSDFTGSISEYLKCTVIQPDKTGKDIVYLFTNAKNAKTGKVYYRSATMTDWELFNEGYPAGMSVNLALPFFRDGKLRVAGNGSVWESPMIDTSFTPIAKAWVGPQDVSCGEDTVFMTDHSLFINRNAKRTWKIEPEPAWISDKNAMNPQVVYGAKGTYNVMLTLEQEGKTYTSSIVPVTVRACPSIETCDNPGLLPKTDWRLLKFFSQEVNYPGLAEMAIDDDPNTIWHTRWSTGNDTIPHEMQIDFGFEYKVFKFAYQGRADGVNGRVKEAEFYFTKDTSDWGKAYLSTFDNSSAIQWLKLDSAGINARYVKFRSLKEINGNPWTTVAEFYAQGCIPQEPSSVKEDMAVLAVFPNPTTGFVNIPISGVHIKHIDIIDVQGRIVRSFVGQFDQNGIIVDCSGIGTGLFQIRLYDMNDTVYRCSIVKQ